MYETDNNHDGGPRGSPDTKDQGDQAFPTLKLDPEKYAHHLKDFEMTDEQAEELLQVLWNIMHAMVDMGMGLDSVQMLFPSAAEKTGQDSGKDSIIKNNKNSFNETATTSRKKG